jgi:CubicO group peptidase (beta-lactamase class C family)
MISTPSSFITHNSSLITRFESTYSQTSRRTNFSGVVSLGTSGQAEPLFARAARWANRSDRLRNRIDTRFATASACKVFTAVAALQLVEAGKLSLDTPVADIIAGFPFGQHVTLHHLLTHTSGLPDYFDEDEEVEIDAYALLWEHRPVYAMQSARDFLPLFYTKSPKYLPGERFAYNNAAFLLLELVVELAGSLPFRETVRRQILEPAGMSASGYFYTDRLPTRTALGYIPLPDGGSWRTNIFAVPYIGGGDGGAYVTAPDWSRFWSALLGGKLLGAEMLAEMLRPQTATNPRPGRHYGLGVWLSTAPLQRAARAIGSDPGVDMVSDCFLDTGLTLTVLSNESGGAMGMYTALYNVLMMDW